MKIGMIGLGKMGTAIALRIMAGGHSVIGYDPSPDAQREAQKDGIATLNRIAQLGQQVQLVWIMVPAGAPVDAVLQELKGNINSDVIIVDGGNSKFTDSVARARRLEQLGIAFLDCGTSGGLAGQERGFSLMIGGNKKAFERIEPIFALVAAPDSYAYVGPSGAGHYVKMVHNGIEYALLQAYAEGFDLLKNGTYKELNLAQIAHIWSKAAVIRSWILDLAENVLQHDQDFAKISGEIAESGMGQWTVEEAHAKKIPVPVIEDALKVRAWSRQSGGNYATKLVALLRQQFGGHAVKKKT